MILDQGVKRKWTSFGMFWSVSFRIGCLGRSGPPPMPLRWHAQFYSGTRQHLIIPSNAIPEKPVPPPLTSMSRSGSADMPICYGSCVQYLVLNATERRWITISYVPGWTNGYGYPTVSLYKTPRVSLRVRQLDNSRKPPK